MDSRQQRLEMLYKNRGKKFIPEKEKEEKVDRKVEIPKNKKAAKKEPTKIPAVIPEEKE